MARMCVFVVSILKNSGSSWKGGVGIPDSSQIILGKPDLGQINMWFNMRMIILGDRIGRWIRSEGMHHVSGGDI